jgi:methylmalonyl-CoA mutase cobalamin-binding subunit
LAWRPGVTADVDRDPSPPLRLVEDTAHEDVAAADGGAGVSGVDECAVEAVEVLGGQMRQALRPEGWEDVVVRCGPVVADRGRFESFERGLLQSGFDGVGDGAGADRDAAPAGLRDQLRQGEVSLA